MTINNRKTVIPRNIYLYLCLKKNQRQNKAFATKTGWEKTSQETATKYPPKKLEAAKKNRVKTYHAHEIFKTYNR